jgi:hypothetical protein
MTHLPLTPNDRAACCLVPWACAMLLALLMLYPVASRAAEPIATANIVQGKVSVEALGAAPRALAAGMPLHAGDRIVTGPDGLVRLMFTDKTMTVLGTNSEMTLVRYSTQVDEPSFVVRVTRGVFRIVTGAIGRTRPRAVQVQAPVATIGIRGTHFAGEVGDSQLVVVLLDPEDQAAANAIEVRNDFGAVSIDRPGYGTEVPDARSPPSPPRQMRIRAVDNLLRSLSTIQRLQAPRPPR